VLASVEEGRVRAMSNMLDHARAELRHMLEGDDTYGKMVAEGVVRLVEEFARQGHSGFSAAMTVSLFTRVATFKPVGPLTGETDEWNDVGGGQLQNKRCPSVFKEGARAYRVDAVVFEDPDGHRYTSRDSFCDVTFPYVVGEPEVCRVAGEGPAA
jgi:hypothetical protein